MWGRSLTFGVVQDPLDQNRVFGDPLGDQQDALLDAMATQQRTTTNPLINTESNWFNLDTSSSTRFNPVLVQSV